MIRLADQYLLCTVEPYRWCRLRSARGSLDSSSATGRTCGGMRFARSRRGYIGHPFEMPCSRPNGGRCAISHLPESRLLDAAHIIMDADEQLGQPIVSNGLPLTKISSCGPSPSSAA